MNASRAIISPTTSSANIYTSSLQLTYLMEGDEGTYKACLHDENNANRFALIASIRNSHRADLN